MAEQGEQSVITETRELAISDVLSYVYGKISSQQWKVRKARKGPHKLVDVKTSKEALEKATQELQRLQALKDAVSRGEYRGVAAELVEDIAREEAIRDGHRSRLSEELPNDDRYFVIKEDMLAGQRVLNKLEDATDRDWVGRVITRLKGEQVSSTERGWVFLKIEEAQAEINHLQDLSQVVAPS